MQQAQYAFLQFLALRMNTSVEELQTTYILIPQGRDELEDDDVLEENDHAQDNRLDVDNVSDGIPAPINQWL